MRRTILLPALALVGGLALGTLLGSSLFSASRGLAAPANGAPAALAAASSTQALTTPEPLDTGDDTHLLERAESVLESLQA